MGGRTDRVRFPAPLGHVPVPMECGREADRTVDESDGAATGERESVMASAHPTHHDTQACALPAGRWDIDPGSSTVGIRGRYLGPLPVRAGLTGITGQIIVEPVTGRTSVAVLIDATTASTATAHYAARLRSRDYLDVDRHPWIGFRSTAVLTAHPLWRVAGNLTIKNTTSTVILHVAPTGVVQDPVTGNRYAGFTADTELDRFTVGVGANRERPDDRPRLGNTIQLRIDILAVLAEPGDPIDVVRDPAA